MPRPKAGEGNLDLIRYAIAGIDAEIKELQEKRAEMLRRGAPKAAAPAAAPATRKRRGRKPGKKKAAVKVAARAGAKKAVKKAAPAAAPKKRKVSPETRRKLKEAAKARWAKARDAKS